eukprot:scaffold91204_cov57-Phaeocystis_antarctica.AAC.1
MRLFLYPRVAVDCEAGLLGCEGRHGLAKPACDGGSAGDSIAGAQRASRTNKRKSERARQGGLRLGQSSSLTELTPRRRRSVGVLASRNMHAARGATKAVPATW